jgi:hypothetical protein
MEPTHKRRETEKYLCTAANAQRSKVAVEYLEVLLRILEVPCSNLCLKTGYLD